MSLSPSSSPVIFSKPSPITSPLLADSHFLPIDDDHLSQIEATLDIPTDTSLKLETHKTKLHSDSIKLFPNIAAVAYTKTKLYAVAVCDAILIAQAIGGKYTRLTLTPHNVTEVEIGGAGLFCAVDLRAAHLKCGPVVCSRPRQAQLLSESSWPALRTSERWCCPVNERGFFVCAKCGITFRSDHDIFEHGKVPPAQRQRLKGVLPEMWRPLPPGRTRDPVPRENLECGSLADRHAGRSHRHHLKAKLLRLARPPLHHPYRIPLHRPQMRSSYR